jgi:Flp pilus assembly protein TadD
MSHAVSTVGQTLLWRVRLVLALWWGRPAHILACLAAWLREQPDHPHALASQAHWLAQTGDWAGASVVLQRVLTLQPEHAAHWFNAGFVHQQLQQWVPAKTAFETALQWAPTLDRAWYGLGVVRWQL